MNFKGGRGTRENAALNQDDSAASDKEDDDAFDCFETSDVEVGGTRRADSRRILLMSLVITKRSNASNAILLNMR
jgi:hypothetical protein